MDIFLSMTEHPSERLLIHASIRRRYGRASLAVNKLDSKPYAIHLAHTNLNPSSIEALGLALVQGLPGPTTRTFAISSKRHNPGTDVLKA